MFSVIICTYNRKAYLEDLVKSLVSHDFSKDGFEIIIVDNASQDGTREEVGRLKEILNFPLIYLLEAQPGVSYARNCGAQHAKGDILVFIDDDAVAASTWLSQISQGFVAFPSAVCLSGGIDLQWDTPKPNWMSYELEGFLGNNLFLGASARILGVNEAIFEGNLAVKKSAFLATDGFDPRLGPRGKSLIMLEGIHLASRLRQFGEIVYLPSALIHHRVPIERANKQYLLRRGYLQGRSNAKLDQITHQRPRRRILRSLLVDGVFLLGDLGTFMYQSLKNNHIMYFRLVNTSSRLGQIREKAALLFA